MLHLNKNVDVGVADIMKIVYDVSGSVVADRLCLDDFTEAMSDTLAEKRAEGRYGWQDPEVILVSDLRKLLDAQLAKQSRNYVDIANLSMMLFYREQQGKDK